MEVVRPFSAALKKLRAAGIRTTRQRLGLARLLINGGDQHVTAEQLYGEASSSGMRVSLATVYNTLNQFTVAGLLREIVVDSGPSYFDTNISDHHHFFFEGTRELKDIPKDGIVVSEMPEPPEGTEVRSVDVVIRVTKSKG